MWCARGVCGVRCAGGVHEQCAVRRWCCGNGRSVLICVWVGFGRWHCRVLKAVGLPPVSAKIEEQTRAVLSGKDINDIYDDGGEMVEESFAEGDGVLRETVPTT